MVIGDLKEIERCPFCGSNRLISVFEEGLPGLLSSKNYIKCKTCGATGPVVFDKKCKNNPTAIVRKWNKRVPEIIKTETKQDSEEEVKEDEYWY